MEDVIMGLVVLGFVIAMGIYFSLRVEKLEKHLSQKHQELSESQAKLLKATEKLSELAETLKPKSRHMPIKEEYEKALKNGDLDIKDG